MSYVPSSAAEVLAPRELIVGDSEEPLVVVGYLTSVSSRAEVFASRLGSAHTQFDTQRGFAVSAIRMQLESGPLPGTKTLAANALSSREQFTRYAEAVRELNHRGSEVLERVDSHLQTIRVQKAEIETIAHRIGAWAEYTWNEGAPSQMPEPRSSGMIETADPSERLFEVERLRQAYGSRWQIASRRWADAIADIDSEGRRWLSLIDQRRAAERALVVSLHRTEIGRLAFSPGVRTEGLSSAIALSFFGTRPLAEAGPLEPPTSHQLLLKLIGTSDGSDIWNNSPNSMMVAANWAKLSAEEQNILIAQVPWVIGNLPGLPFTPRDLANQNLVDFYNANRDRLDPRSLAALDAVIGLMDRDKTGVPPRYIVALNLQNGEVPMVAVGYGDLDSADNLTWEVPGMESDADNALEIWDRASRNLYTEQKLLAGLNDLGSVGVIAFLSYDTPDLADSIDVWGGLKPGADGVLSPDLARLGAARLAAELDGTWAARNQPLGVSPGYVSPDSPRISVVAHSYGTTTAADALMLVRYEVDSFTMLGSAGLDTGRVPSLEALAVAEPFGQRQQIYANSAEGDRLATLGMKYGGRGNPNPQYQVDGLVNYEGAGYFHSDGFVTSNGEVFQPTDGHSVIGEKKGPFMSAPKAALYLLGFEASKGRGYWDAGTESLRNMAATSLGLPGEVLEGVSYAK